MAGSGGQRVRIDMTGVVIGELECLAFAGLDRNNAAQWTVRCSCGVVKIANGILLRSGAIKSCGHLKRMAGARHQFKHGHAKRGAKTKAYQCWRNMLTRCYDPKSQRFKSYGGRGIRVCDEWKSFENFLRDMGEPPPGLSIDRIDVNGNYEPSNCRWATAQEQSFNKTNSIKNRRPLEDQSL